MVLTGAEVLVEELKREGVPWVATLCGNGLHEFFEASDNAGLRLIDVHNEQAASYIAEAYAKLTGNVGVCAVSSGVAHTNALTGVTNAYFDGAPILLISGASQGYGSGREVFQEMDQVDMASPICKYSKLVRHVKEIIFHTRSAFNTALSGRPGPVHLTIPVDVFRDDFKESYTTDRKTSRGESSLEATSIHSISKALNAIETAEKPILIAGSGVFYSKGNDALQKFCEATSIPIMIPIWDRGTIEEKIPNFLGVIGAASGSPRVLGDADLVILAGVKVDYRLGFMVPPVVGKEATLIRIDVDPSYLRQGVDPDISILASPKHVFELFNERINENGSSFRGAGEWLIETQNRLNIFRKRWLERDPQGDVTGLELVKAIQPALCDDPIFLVDGGNIGQWTHMVLGNRYPGRWLTCGASGVVGWGIPGAIGAKLAYPEDPVLLLSGDGAFGFTAAEIESAVKHKTPFVAVVANDCGWGIVISSQLESRGDRGTIASRFSDIRYDKVAEGFGARGFRVENLERLTDVIKEGFSADIPTIIDVPINVSRPSDLKI